MAGVKGPDSSFSSSSVSSFAEAVDSPFGKTYNWVMRQTFMKAGWVITLLAGLCAPAAAEIYTWRDSAGVLNATNSRDNIPGNVKVEVLPEVPRTPAPPAPKPAPEPSKTEATAPVETAAPAPAEAAQATEGAFAVQLIGELGLGRDVSPREAADLLSRIRVAPPLGRWELDAPITPALTARLRTLTVAAAERGAISVQPEEALLAFDTSAALLGVSIPVHADSTDRLAERAAPALVDAPPLVLINAPPAQIISSYYWVPVDRGFVWNGVPCTGFFVLNQHRGGRFVFLQRDAIARRFDDRLHDRFIVDRSFTRPFDDDRLPTVFIVPPSPEPRHRRVPPALPPRAERHLHGGTPRFFNGAPTVQPAPPNANVLTPLAPRQGFSISPMAPPLLHQSHNVPSVSPRPAARPHRPAVSPRALRG